MAKTHSMMPLDQLASIEDLLFQRILSSSSASSSCVHGPFVTLTFAQSLDGSIAAKPGEPLILSGSESMSMTHRLRSVHEGICVGIGTVLADDPSLSVRLVQGRHPVPIVVDSHLRIPTSARLFHCVDQRKTVVACVDRSGSANDTTEWRQRIKALEEIGSIVLQCPSNDRGSIDLQYLFASDVLMEKAGISSVMVEGGAGLITSILREHDEIVDHVVITIAPVFVGGFRAVESLLSSFPRLQRPSYARAGADIIVSGSFR